MVYKECDLIGEDKLFKVQDASLVYIFEIIHMYVYVIHIYYVCVICIYIKHFVTVYNHYRACCIRLRLRAVSV